MLSTAVTLCAVGILSCEGEMGITMLVRVEQATRNVGGDDNRIDESKSR